MINQDSYSQKKKKYLIVKLFIKVKIALGIWREENSFFIMNAEPRGFNMNLKRIKWVFIKTVGFLV